MRAAEGVPAGVARPADEEIAAVAAAAAAAAAVYGWPTDAVRITIAAGGPLDEGGLPPVRPSGAWALAGRLEQAAARRGIRMRPRSGG